MGENDHNVPPVAARRDAAIWSYRGRAKLKHACRGHALVGEVWSAFEVSVSRVDERHGNECCKSSHGEPVSFAHGSLSCCGLS